VRTSEYEERAALAGGVSQVVEHCFRHESAKMVAALTRIFGIDRLNLAEDLVQEALVKALQTWPYYGIPQNPSAWITQVAKNLALDFIRREKVFRDKQDAIVASSEQRSVDSVNYDSLFSENEIKDDHLRMMFACCHPIIPPEAQVALALKTLCGFSPAEIARAFLTNEAAIAKRLTRAKQRIREARIPYEIPVGEALAERLDAVLQTLYLLFNEGYKASYGEKLIRNDLCQEAIRLTTLLVEHPSGNLPRAHALLALMLLNGARLAARVDTEGNILRLKEQDRSQWNKTMIARGMLHLTRSAAGEEISEYHLQAGISACHCAAVDYESTDWRQILSLYDRLVAINYSAIVALNRAVAVAHVHGPKAAIEATKAIRDRSKLDNYYLLYAVLGEFEAQLNNFEAAADYFRQALSLTTIRSEEQFLSKKLSACEDAIPRRA
jgi:RNA polymerase sigma-70 factor (ECF subfamily)